MTICIIPARSGSKRIKNKNIIKINGIPLIGLTIKIAKKSKLFKRIVVSTDSIKVAKIAREYGAEVPFLRSAKLSDDFTPTYKVLTDCVNRINSKKTSYHFCIYPASILINKQDLSKAFTKMKKMKADFICPIAKFESNPYRSLIIKKNFIKYNWPKYHMKRSQDLDNLYYDTGSFYIYKTSSLFQITKKMILPKKSTYLIIKKKLIDVNYPEDLKTLKEHYNNKRK
jgi:pseudaminic acid cytidylyltransferase